MRLSWRLSNENLDTILDGDSIDAFLDICKYFLTDCLTLNLFLEPVRYNKTPTIGRLGSDDALFDD